jgi:hypothetical protein
MHANEAQNRPGEKTANECSSRCPIPNLLQRLLHNFVLLKPSQVLVDFVEVDIISGEVQVAQIELELGMGGKGVLEGGRLDREEERQETSRHQSPYHQRGQTKHLRLHDGNIG